MSNRIDIATRRKLVKKGFRIISYNYKGILEWTEGKWITIYAHTKKYNKQNYEAVKSELEFLSIQKNVIVVIR